MLVVASRHALCNKKVVALCRDHFVKKKKQQTVTLCNKLGIDGRRARRPNTSHHPCQ